MRGDSEETRVSIDGRSRINGCDWRESKFPYSTFTDAKVAGELPPLDSAPTPIQLAEYALIDGPGAIVYNILHNPNAGEITQTLVLDDFFIPDAFNGADFSYSAWKNTTLANERNVKEILKASGADTTGMTVTFTDPKASVIPTNTASMTVKQEKENKDNDEASVVEEESAGCCYGAIVCMSTIMSTMWCERGMAMATTGEGSTKTTKVPEPPSSHAGSITP